MGMGLAEAVTIAIAAGVAAKAVNRRCAFGGQMPL